MPQLRTIRPAGERVLSHAECYWCGQSPKLADQLIPANRHHFTQSIVLVLRTPCCHAPVSTEPWGSVLDYLCDGWKRAQMLCGLYNASVGAPVEKDCERPAWCEAPPRDGDNR